MADSVLVHGWAFYEEVGYSIPNPRMEPDVYWVFPVEILPGVWHYRTRVSAGARQYRWYEPTLTPDGEWDGRDMRPLRLPLFIQPSDRFPPDHRVWRQLEAYHARPFPTFHTLEELQFLQDTDPDKLTPDERRRLWDAGRSDHVDPVLL